MEQTDHELVELGVARFLPARGLRLELRRHGRQPLQHVRWRAHLKIGRVIS